MEKINNPFKFFKKWILNLLVPYIEGTNKKKKEKESWFMTILNSVYYVILFEIILLILLFIYFRKHSRSKDKQPSLSKEYIKSLKFVKMWGGSCAKRGP